MNLFKTPIYFLLIIMICYNCKNDDDSTGTTPIELTDNVEVYNADLFEDSYVLAVENGGLTSYLVDKTGHKVKEWIFDTNLGNDLELLPNGQLIGMFKVENPDISFGGFGGNIKLLDANGNVTWEYVYASNDNIAHHDVEMLPNGNILFLAAERVGSFIGALEGVASADDIFPEAIFEINPNTNEIVWEWHSFDHIIQDLIPTALNFGNVSNNPQRIDINYNLVQSGDIMHSNGLDYDPINDVIFMSINGYSEVWVIDHSTTTLEAASDIGGNYNKGGNLLYRFGNPEAYQNPVGTRLFYNNHFPNLLEGDEPGAGNILIFGNGNDINQSTVYELDLPETFELIPNENHDPEVVWSFTDPDLFFGRISGAVRLKNGNTLISEGDYGFWEVTRNGEIAWKYNGLGPNFWRCYGYTRDSQEIQDLNLE